MASSDNFMTMMEPWGFHSTFNNTWFPETFSKETETLTKVLQNSFSGQDSPFTAAFATPSASAGQTISGGSENETAASKRQCIKGGAGVAKKITKRKPRASKRASTTYITADVESFRQMVQQVTGVRFGAGNGVGNGHVAVVGGSVLKPEPRRPVDRVQPVINCLPTLDTSAFLLDHTSSFMPTPPQAAVVDGVSGGGFGYESLIASSFPTLESWERNVMN